MSSNSFLSSSTDTSLKHGGGRIAAAIRDIQGTIQSSNTSPFSLSPGCSPSFSPKSRKLCTRTSPAISTPVPDGSASHQQSDNTRKANVSSRLELLRNKYFVEESPIGQGRDHSRRKLTYNDHDDNSDSSDDDHDVEFSKTLLNESISEMTKTFDVEQARRNKASQQEGFVGFSSLPSQMYRKAVKKGFEFVLLVVGETGLGKSTLINSMFLTDIYTNKEMVKMKRTVEVGTHQVMLEEGGVKLSLTVVDTPGYGDAVDNTDCWEPVVEYVEEQFEKFLEAETRVKRESLPDSRVHACLYFIAPSGHGLKRIDVEFMKRIHDKVNIIPVIGKADACTKEELDLFKQKIRNQLEEFEISVYEFPRDGVEAESSDIRAPFAVVGSNAVVEDGAGRRFRGRRYPWGCVNIEDQSHSDFSLLRKLLLCQHTQHMIDLTSSIHYENYRCNKLTTLVGGVQGTDLSGKNLLTFLENESEDHKHGVENMKNQMERVFNEKVKEKQRNLALLEIKQKEDIEPERKAINLERSTMLSKRAEYEKEKTEWEQRSQSSFNRGSKSMESLGRRNKFKFSLSSVNFSKQ